MQSCIRTRDIPIPVDESFESKLVVNAFLERKGVFRIMVTKTVQLAFGGTFIFFEPEVSGDILKVENAVFKLFQNGELILTDAINGIEEQVYELDVEPSYEYKIVVTAPEFEDTYSTNQKFDFANTFEVGLDSTVFYDIAVNGYGSDEFYWKLYINSSTDYLFFIDVDGSFASISNFDLQFESCDMYARANKFLFNNNCFEDSLSINYLVDLIEGSDVIFNISTISEDYNKYLQFLKNPYFGEASFTDPNISYSNFSNGRGIFALIDSRAFRFEY